MSLAGGATAGPPPAAVHDAVVGALRRSRAAPPGGAARSVLSQLRSVALRDDICRRLDAPPRAPNLVAVAPDIWQADFGGGGKCWGSEVLRLASRKSLGDVQWAVELLQEQLGATDVDVTIAQREAEAGYRVAATTAALYCGGGGSEAAWLAPSAFEVDAPPSRGRAARAALRGGALRCEERLARIGGAPCFGGVLRCVEVSVDVIVTGPDLSRAVDLFALLVLRRSIHAARARASCRVVALETAAAGPAFGGDGTPAAKTAAAAFSAAPVALRWDVSRLKSDPAAQANFTLALRTATVTLHAPARLALLALAPQQRSERPRLVHFEVEFTLHFRAAARPGPQATSFTRSARADDGVFFSREAADRYVAGRAGAPRAAAAPVDAARAALQRGDANAALIALVPSLLLDRQRAATADGGAVDAAVLRRGLYTLRFGPRELRCGALALADAARILARHLRSEDFAGGGGADDWLDAFDADFAKWRRSALLYVGGDAGPDAALLAQTLRAEIVAFSRDGAEASAAATDACLVRMVAAAAQQRVDDHDHAAHAPHVPHSEAPLARRRVPRAAVAPSAERRRDEVVDALLLGATGGGTCLRAEFLGRASPEDKAGGARLHKCAAGLAALAHRLEAVGAALGVLERSVTCDALATLGVRETVEARRAQQRTARQTRGRAPDKGVCDALAALLQRPDGARVDTDAGETTPRPQHAEAPGDAAAVSATLVAVEAGADVSLDVQGLDGALAQSRLDGAFAAATRAVAASRARREAPRLAWFVDGGGAADGGGGDDDASFGAGGDPDDVGRLAAACERELYDAAVSAVAPAQPWTALISRVSCDVARSQTETSSHRDDIALFERALTARHAAQPCADAAPPAAKRRSASLGDRAPAWDRLRTFEFFEDCSSTAAAVASAAAAAWKRQRLRVAVAAQRTKNVQKSYDDQLAHNVAAGVAMDRLGAAATLSQAADEDVALVSSQRLGAAAAADGAAVLRGSTRVWRVDVGGAPDVGGALDGAPSRASSRPQSRATPRRAPTQCELFGSRVALMACGKSFAVYAFLDQLRAALADVPRHVADAAQQVAKEWATGGAVVAPKFAAIFAVSLRGESALMGGVVDAHAFAAAQLDVCVDCLSPAAAELVPHALLRGLVAAAQHIEAALNFAARVVPGHPTDWVHARWEPAETPAKRRPAAGLPRLSLQLALSPPPPPPDAPAAKSADAGLWTPVLVHCVVRCRGVGAAAINDDASARAAAMLSQNVYLDRAAAEALWDLAPAAVLSKRRPKAADAARDDAALDAFFRANAEDDVAQALDRGDVLGAHGLDFRLALLGSRKAEDAGLQRAPGPDPGPKAAPAPGLRQAAPERRFAAHARVFSSVAHAARRLEAACAALEAMLAAPRGLVLARAAAVERHASVLVRGCAALLQRAAAGHVAGAALLALAAVAGDGEVGLVDVVEAIVKCDADLQDVQLDTDEPPPALVAAARLRAVAASRLADLRAVFFCLGRVRPPAFAPPRMPGG